MDFYHLFGYLSGLLFIKPQMEPATLLRTAGLVHALDGILCRVVAGHGKRRANLWMLAGLLLGFWALATLFLLPAKARRGD